MLISQAHYRRNKLHTALIVGGLTCALSLVGWLVGGVSVMISTMLSVLCVAIFAPYVSPQFILHLHKAQPLSVHDSPSIHVLVNELVARADLPQPPKVYYLPTNLMMAFTVGLKNNASIAVSDGLLRRMNRREMNAVLAHEISHIANQDMRIMAIADAMDQLVRVLSTLGLLWLFFSLPLFLFSDYVMPWLAIILLVLLPNVTTLMKMKLSQTREFEADRLAAELTQDPLALISALSRLEYREWRWLSRFVMLPKQPAELSPLRTHPETDERIARLQIQAEEMAARQPSYFTRGLDRLLSKHVWELNQRNFLGPKDER